MSFSLAISRGDLVQQGSNLGIVWGADKLKQDLSLWLIERYGGDRFHPTMGSTLQDFIGGVVGSATKSLIYSEVLRVFDNYQATQWRALQAAPQNFSLSELLLSVDSVDVRVTYDTVRVDVKIRTADSLTSTISVTHTV